LVDSVRGPIVKAPYDHGDLSNRSGAPRGVGLSTPSAGDSAPAVAARVLLNVGHPSQPAFPPAPLHRPSPGHVPKVGRSEGGCGEVGFAVAGAMASEVLATSDHHRSETYVSFSVVWPRSLPSAFSQELSWTFA
jgi:hypothetical protein